MHLHFKKAGHVNWTAWLILALFCGLASGQAEKPVRLKVGDSSVDGATIKPYKNRFDQSALLPDGTVRAGFIYWTDEVELTNLQGRPLLKRTIITYRIRDGAVLSFGGALFDPKTLAPVSSSETQSAEDYWHMNFDGDGLSGIGVKVSPPRGSAPKFMQWKFSEPAFDPYNATFGLLFAALPLKAGYSATLPVVSDDKDAFEPLTARVIRQETIELSGGKRVSAWVVEDDRKKGRGTFWLIKEPPYVVKIKQENLSNGRTVVFTWTATM